MYTNDRDSMREYQTECRYCGTPYYPNMYGMGRCSNCGYQYHPMNKVHEMKLNEDWHPPKKEIDVGMTDFEGGERIAQDQVPGRDMALDQRKDALDIVVSAIIAGKLDKDLRDLENLILTRNRVRKEEVTALVQEVYGENYTISTTKGIRNA